MRKSIKRPMKVDLKIQWINMRFFLLGICFVFVSCGSQKKKALTDGEVRGGAQELTLVLRDNYSGSDVAETLIIDDVKALKTFYSKINRTRKPGLPVPTVDFTKEMIVIHCSGIQKSNVESSLAILNETKDELVIEISKGKKVQKKKVSAEISPFSIYKMPRTSKRVIFEKEQ